MWSQRWQPTRLPRPWDSPGKNTGVGCHFLFQCRKVKSESEVARSCPTLRYPMNYSLPGSSVHGIFQARVLEWGAIAFSDLLSKWLLSIQYSIFNYSHGVVGFPGGAGGKEPACHCRRHKRQEFDPSVRKIPLEEGLATHSSILAWRIPVDTGAWGETVYRVTKSQTRLKQPNTPLWCSILYPLNLFIL